MKIPQKPPIGLRPANIWLYERIQEINHAIARYTEAHSELPVNWIEERNDLLKRESDVNKKEDFAKRATEILQHSVERYKSFSPSYIDNEIEKMNELRMKNEDISKYSYSDDKPAKKGILDHYINHVSEKDFIEALKTMTGCKTTFDLDKSEIRFDFGEKQDIDMFNLNSEDIENIAKQVKNFSYEFKVSDKFSKKASEIKGIIDGVDFGKSSSDKFIISVLSKCELSEHEKKRVEASKRKSCKRPSMTFDDRDVVSFSDDAEASFVEPKPLTDEDRSQFKKEWAEIYKKISSKTFLEWLTNS